MDSNTVSPMPELAPIAEFDKSPPSPPNEEVPMDDLPPPPATISGSDVKKVKIRCRQVGIVISLCFMVSGMPSLSVTATGCVEVGRMVRPERVDISERGDTDLARNMLM
ncbi:hypothetical protein O0L34_g7002 [Tuta absoluta]|nr:hypothetical protein O0L34_g7002 [Tuta absoluta]